MGMPSSYRMRAAYVQASSETDMAVTKNSDFDDEKSINENIFSWKPVKHCNREEQDEEARWLLTFGELGIQETEEKFGSR